MSTGSLSTGSSESGASNKTTADRRSSHSGSLLVQVIALWVFMVIDGLAGLGALVVMGRFLPMTDYGEVHYSVAACQIAGTLVLMGQREAIVRVFANDALDLDWKSYAVTALKRFTAAVAPVGACVYFFAPTQNLVTLLATMVMAMLFAVRQLFAIGLLRSFRFALAGAIFRSTSGLLSLAAVFLLPPRTGAAALSLLAVSYFVPTIGSVIFAFVKLPNGQRAVGSAPWRDGRWFWLTSTLLAMSRTTDRVVVGAAISPESLAAFGSLATLMGGFDLVILAVGYNLLPRFADRKEGNARKLSIEVLVAGGMVAVAYLVFGARLFHDAYSGQYDAAIGLIPVFTLTGLVRVAHIVPWCLIAARLESATLRMFALGSLLLTAPTLVGMWWAGRTFGMAGVAWSSLVIHVLRLVFALVVARRSERPDEAESA